jgi:hypothetical protein
VGQLLATLVGRAVRNRLTWQPARTVDAFGGAVVSVVSLLLVAWLVGSAVASSPFPTLASRARNSDVLQASTAPSPRRSSASSARSGGSSTTAASPRCSAARADQVVEGRPAPTRRWRQRVVQAAAAVGPEDHRVAESCRRPARGDRLRLRARARL